MRHLLLCLLLTLLYRPAYAAAPYAVAVSATPVFSSRQAAAPGAVYRPDRCGQVRELEFIALPGTVFNIVNESGDSGVLQVTTADYLPPAGTALFVAQETLELRPVEPARRPQVMPRADQVIAGLRSAVGLPYVWGGNWRDGIVTGGKRQFGGLDCSGLLYEATNGATPRNTAQLVRFGTAVPAAGSGPEALFRRLRPLDLLVWKGHVIIVLDRHTAVESILDCRGPGGVVTTPLKQRLVQLFRQRRPADRWPDDQDQAGVFVVRRWHPSAL